jgi:hypothetical protein
MAFGHYDGLGVEDPRFRELFTRGSLIASAWYKRRLVTKQRRDLARLRRHRADLEGVTALRRQKPELHAARRAYLERELARVGSPEYLDALMGTLGADPFDYQGVSAEGLALTAE